MKCDITHDPATGAEFLRGTISHQEPFDENMARLLAASHSDALLGFGYARGGKGRTVMQWNITGMTTLSRILAQPQRPLPPGFGFRNIVESEAAVLTLCRDRASSSQNIMWLPQLTYVDRTGNVRFMAVPATLSMRQQSPAVYLADIARNWLLPLAGPNEATMRDAVSQWNGLSEMLFDLSAYVAFLNTLLAAYPAATPQSIPQPADFVAPVAAGRVDTDEDSAETTLASPGTRAPQETPAAPVNRPFTTVDDAAETVLASAYATPGSSTPDQVVSFPLSNPSSPQTTSLNAADGDDDEQDAMTVLMTNLTASPRPRPAQPRPPQIQQPPQPQGFVTAAELARRANRAAASAFPQQTAPQRPAPQPVPPTAPQSSPQRPVPQQTFPALQTTEEADDVNTRLNEQPVALPAAMPSAAPIFEVTRVRDGLTRQATMPVVSIGRSAQANLHMGGNVEVSRIHAYIAYQGDGTFRITDNNSSNGTSVANVMLPRGGQANLPDGASFDLGGEQFVIRLIR